MADDYVDDGAEEEMVDDEPLTEDDDMQQDDDAASQETQDAPEIEEEVRTEGSQVCMGSACAIAWRHPGNEKHPWLLSWFVPMHGVRAARTRRCLQALPNAPSPKPSASAYAPWPKTRRSCSRA